MTAVFYYLNRPDAPLETSGTYIAYTISTQAWLLSCARFYDSHWETLGVPIFNTTYQGVWPQVTQAEAISPNPDQIKIRVNITYNGEDISNVGTEYSRGGAAYTPLGDPFGDNTSPKDKFDRTPWLDPSRPTMAYRVGSDATADLTAGDSYFRENHLALFAIICLQDHDPAHWGYVPGLTMETLELNAEGWVTKAQMKVNATQLTLLYEISYYDPDDYDLADSRYHTGAPEVLRRTLKISTRKRDAEPFYVLENWLYIRRGNGSVSRIVRQTLEA